MNLCWAQSLPIPGNPPLKQKIEVIWNFPIHWHDMFCPKKNQHVGIYLGHRHYPVWGSSLEGTVERTLLANS
jgi:hypothetical protein